MANLFELLTSARNKIKTGLQNNAFLNNLTQRTPYIEDSNAEWDKSMALEARKAQDEAQFAQKMQRIQNNPNSLEARMYNFGNNLKDFNLGDALLGRQATPTDTMSADSNGLKITTSENPRIGGILRDITGGYQENRFTPASLKNLGQNTLEGGRQKGFAYRLGEGLGSISKLANSPLGRSLIVGGLIAGMGGTGAEALTYGASTGMLNQQNKTKDQLYRQSLKDNYGFSDEELNGITGYLNDTTFKNLADTSYKNKKMQQTQQLALLKDNTSKAKLIGDWLKAGQITPQEASQLITAYGITNADFQVADSTRAINSRIAVNNARIENINNPKPKTIIHKSNNSTGATRQSNGVGRRISTNKTKIEAPNGQIYLVDSNRVQEYINAGGKVVQ